MNKFLISALLLAGLAAPALAQEPGQRTFATPEEAAKALVEATSANDLAALEKLVGSNAKAMITTGDAAEDAANHEAFVKKSKEKMHLVKVNDSLNTMVIGVENFPVPLPLVKKKQDWYFDGVLGLEEVRARRIGKNELSVIRACEAYTHAQREYAAIDPDSSGIARYAQAFASQSGKHDGLYWEAGPGESPSPLGPFMAEAANKGAAAGKPFHGYSYRILTGQGPSAPGGAYSYIINGNMVAGFALVAYPASYGHSGIMTFMVGPGGVIYQRDLKDKTAEMGTSMKTFDPGPGWKRL